jgi:hypothetical protein
MTYVCPYIIPNKNQSSTQDQASMKDPIPVGPILVCSRVDMNYESKNIIFSPGKSFKFFSCNMQKKEGMQLIYEEI